MQKILLYYLRKFPLDYGKKHLAKWVRFDPKNSIIKYTNNDGITFNLDLNEYQMKQIYLYDLYEKNTIQHVIKQLKRLNKNNLTIFDVGANIGFYSITISKKLGNSKPVIHSFEPNPFTYSEFTKNIDLNQDNSIVPNMVGLSNKEEILKLSFNHRNLGAANVFSSDGEQTVDIKLTTLDKYCEEKNIHAADFIKVDIEGSELNFLKGAENILKQSKQLVVIMEIVEENCLKAGYKSTDLFNFMIVRGFLAYLPKPWPFRLKPITTCPTNYHDNIFFVKGIKI